MAEGRDSSTTVCLPSLEKIKEARKRISPHVVRTPLIKLNVPSEEQRNGDVSPLEIYLKLENLQHTNSFKARGAFSALLNCDEEQLKEGVITASAGNFGQGLAWCARNRDVPCTVVIPDTAAETKQNALQGYGAEVIAVPFSRWWETLESRQFKGHELKHFVHPCADSDVFAGNGSIALEILEDLPTVDTILVPYGGGGMCCGIGTVLRELKPDTKLFACEIETSTPVAAALQHGRPTQCNHRPSFVDGIGSPCVLPDVWSLARDLLTDSITVSLQQTADAIRLLVERNRVVAEGAGAVPVAAALSGKAGRGKIVCVVSGGNIDTATLLATLQGEVPQKASGKER